MTRPGDPGHAASARAARTASRTEPTHSDGDTPPAADAPTASPTASATAPAEGAERAEPPRRTPRTLRRRLLVILTTLLVAVSALVGVASIAVFHTSSVERLDVSLRSAADRATLAQEQSEAQGLPTDPAAVPDLFLRVPGQPAGTLAAIITPDDRVFASYIGASGAVPRLDAKARAALAEVPRDASLHSITVGAFGDYRALAVPVDQYTAVFALPLADVNAQTSQLAFTITAIALAGLAVALAAGWIVVTRALAPLARVTSTAQRVSELPLDRGEVDLTERVADVDERTEVGRLGGAFNRMLGHVASALSAREQSEQKVRRFVADASHELRTPLASIRGYAELTRMHGGELPPDVMHAIGRIESESVRMTELVEDLLLLARLDEGRELAARPVDLGRVVVEALGDAQAAGPDHEWEVRLPDAPVIVSGDESRLRQVVTNLLANARVHTPAGTAVVASLEHDGDDVVLTVDDDGPGIPPALADSLFERFARGDSSRSRVAGSTGLGLAIVRAVTLAHGGTVEVESEPGRTRFAVRLPAAPLPAVRPAPDVPAR
ncbi:two-component sensor histidine kinase [Agromyces badenianii]|uniref:histidine kinase n=1 Tax=Agromyces badenianii TaxID=2080742 RepID=A0A2S0WTG8_9MICO|nr:HAMP domain-containing sensor histidine kinase [Agromyces badenianii]AWB94627.1 two-component sensor histidine kinase [Agromyces badenianii]PWC03584.1 sensor histidine kinase [Agromyces badenianii]